MTSVRAVEPVDSSWDRAQSRVAAFGRPVERIGLDGARVDLDDASVDVVVSTWTLCTISDVRSALAGARRVLRPGGRLAFVEHSSAPDAGVTTWQRRLAPVWAAVGGGCRLDRDIPALLEGAGFDVAIDESAYLLDGAGRLSTWFVWGSARTRC